MSPAPEGFDLVLDRRPDAIGRESCDWAGMQVSRIWAVPLFEALAGTGEYRSVGAMGIRRLSEQEWLVDLNDERVGSASHVLDEWRRNVLERGAAAFFFMSRAAAFGPTALLIVVRQPYSDIRPFLDAFDLWIGLGKASEAQRARTRDAVCDTYPLAGAGNVRVLEDRTARGALCGRRWVAAGLPASSWFSRTTSATLLTFITVPIGSKQRMTPISDRALRLRLAESPSVGHAFELLDRPTVSVDFAAPRAQLQYADFEPNREIARAVAAAVCDDDRSPELALLSTPYCEDAGRMFSAGLAMTVAVPLNSASTGLVRTLAFTPWITGAGRASALAFDQATRRAEAQPRRTSRIAEQELTSAAGVGFVARYVAGRSDNHGWGAPVSEMGILPLSELEAR